MNREHRWRARVMGGRALKRSGAVGAVQRLALRAVSTGVLSPLGGLGLGRFTHSLPPKRGLLCGDRGFKRIFGAFGRAQIVARTWQRETPFTIEVGTFYEKASLVLPSLIFSSFLGCSRAAAWAADTAVLPSTPRQTYQARQS